MDREMSDPAIDEVRAVRHRISARFDHDPGRLVAYYMELQERFRDRLIDAPHPPVEVDPGGRHTPAPGGRSKLTNRENDGLRTQGVKTLVEEVLRTIPTPHSEDIIDEVCLAIEASPHWLNRYRELCDELGVVVVNNWVGMWVARTVGREGDHQVKASSSLIESYSKLYP
jgi:hypothetical protein